MRRADPFGRNVPTMIEFISFVFLVSYVIIGFRFITVSYGDMKRYSKRLNSLVNDSTNRSRREDSLIRKVRESRRNLFLSPVWPVIIVLYIWDSLSDTSKSLDSAEKVRDMRIRDEIRAEIRNAELNILKDFDNRLNGE